MRKLLFLDFDGVLHAEWGPVFSRLDFLEQCLTGMPDVEIVVSSSWREIHPLEELKRLFSPRLRKRVVGATPILDCRFDQGGRQREIEAFLQAAGLHGANASWVALDDIAEFFDAGCAYLILVDAQRGFGEDERRRLLAWYRSTP